MTRTTKTILIVTCCALAIIAAGAVVVWNTYVGPFMQQTRVAMRDGMAFAETTDQNGCVAEARSRGDSTNDFKAMLASQSMFVMACLAKSKEVPGFCDNVPRERTDTTQAARWKEEHCHGMSASDMRCDFIAGTVIAHCDNSRKNNG